MELKPCPFCGGEASLSEGRKNSMPHAYVECLECGASSDISEKPVLKYNTDSVDEVIEKWNKRSIRRK